MWDLHFLSEATRRPTATTAESLCQTLSFSVSLSILPFPSLCIPPPPPSRQALSAQGDLERAKEELKNAMTVVATPLPPPPLQPEAHGDNEHGESVHADDEHDENHAEASAELSNEGVSQLDLRSEEARVTEAQKNERVKQQLQVSRDSVAVCCIFSWMKASSGTYRDLRDRKISKNY